VIEISLYKSMVLNPVSIEGTSSALWLPAEQFRADHVDDISTTPESESTRMTLLHCCVFLASMKCLNGQGDHHLSCQLNINIINNIKVQSFAMLHLPQSQPHNIPAQIFSNLFRRGSDTDRQEDLTLFSRRGGDIDRQEISRCSIDVAESLLCV
jgi:hypothetical protein